MSTNQEAEIWEFLARHMRSIFTKDVQTYAKTTSADLSLYEWFVVPHRQDGLDFHFFMIEHGWAGDMTDFRFDFLEPRLQLYENAAIVSYTLMITYLREGEIHHRTHNETRVLIKEENEWQIVHVHKSPAWKAPYERE